MAIVIQGNVTGNGHTFGNGDVTFQKMEVKIDGKTVIPPNTEVRIKMADNVLTIETKKSQ